MEPTKKIQPTVASSVATTLSNPQVLLDWIAEDCAKSAISPELAAINIFPVTAAEATERLGYTAYSDGWWMGGCSPRTGRPYGGKAYGQFKPMTPWETLKKDDGNYGEPVMGKGPKYRTGSLSDYGALCPVMIDSTYWPNVVADTSIDVTVTEGGKKTLSGLSHDICTIGVLGVTMWHKPGEADKLVPELEVIAQKGRRINLAFDSDWHENPNVRTQLLKLGRLLKKRGCDVYIVDWDSRFKGMDDYIAANGGEAFKERIADAQTLANWERQLKDANKLKNIPPSPRQVALELAELYRAKWAFHNEQKVWRSWNEKYWESIEEEVFGQIVFTEIESRNINYKTDSYIQNAIKILRRALLIPKWQAWDKKRYINAQNGIYDLQEGKTLPHSPGARFTSILPHPVAAPNLSLYASPVEALAALCPHTHKFMATAMRDSSKKILKLLATLNAVLKWRWGKDLQMFAHCLGEPGSGKGTFARLVEKLVGPDNYAPIKGRQLNDGSHIARIIDKQAVVFADERKAIDNIDLILNLTGNDAISYREVYKPSANGYFEGCVLMLSNNPIFVGDTTGIDRRLCLLHFNNPLPGWKRNPKIEDLMTEEIPSLIPVALILSDERVTEILRGLGDDEIADFRAQEWEIKKETSSIAAWLNERVVYDLAHPHTQIGDGAKPNTLYSDYRSFCEATNLKPYSLQLFGKNLETLCRDFLGWDVKRIRLTSNPGKGQYVMTHLRLRQSEGDDQPYIDELFCSGEGAVKAAVKAETLDSEEGEGGEELSIKLASQENHSADKIKSEEKIEKSLHSPNFFTTNTSSLHSSLHQSFTEPSPLDSAEPVETPPAPPKLTPADARLILSLAHCFPSQDAVIGVASQLDAADGLDSAFWEAFGILCGELPIGTGEPDWRSYPHSRNIHASELHRKQEAEFISRWLSEAGSIEALQKAIARAFNAYGQRQLEWVCSHALAGEVRDRIHKMALLWLDAKLHPQLSLGF